MLNEPSGGSAASQGRSDVRYFAEHPCARYRLTYRVLNPETGYFLFDFKTRGGGHMCGDLTDLRSALNSFKNGTPIERLLKALRWMAIRQVHRVQSGAPDFISGHRCFWDGSGFGAWVAAHG